MDNSQDFILREYTNGNVIIKTVLVKYNGPGGDVVIPDGVTEIQGFDPPLTRPRPETAEITSVTIPKSVKLILSDAFCNCAGLKTVYIPETDLNIMASAFRGCNALECFSVSSDNPKYTGNNALLLTKDGKRLICAPSASGEFRIPEGIEKIGVRAFQGCHKLTKVIFPKTAVEILGSAFADCANLQSITIPNGMRTIGSNAFEGCHKLKNVVLPDSLENIGSSAFKDCSALDKIVLPSHALELGYDLFRGCTNLQSLLCAGEELVVSKIGNQAGDNLFLETPFAGQLVVVHGCLLQLGVSQYTPKGLTLCIPDGVTSIPTNLIDIQIDSNKFDGVDAFILNGGITDAKTLGHLLKYGVNISFDAYARAYAVYSGKGIDAICEPILAENVTQAVSRFIQCDLNKKQCRKVAEYLAKNRSVANRTCIQAIYNKAVSLKEKKAIELLGSILSDGD